MIGAEFRNGRCRFRVWAPEAKSVELRLDRPLPMTPTGDGYFERTADVPAGTLYLYRVDGVDRPDPASRSQPEGVAGPSEVFDPSFAWPEWPGVELRDYVIYELHVGTFTKEGTFDAAVTHLDELRELGVTAVELMPIAQFPGDRNWGYDGAFPFAVQNTYGGPRGLQRFVNECHRRGLAVVLDVVHNHLGPEGNALWGWGPYFTDRYRTPWGSAINFDGAGSDDVRGYFIENALYWTRDMRVDALRLDAVHAIIDLSARPFLQELEEAVDVPLIVESNRNDPRQGLDAQWNDDFHHALHALLTGERSGYYEDFGSLDQLAKAITSGFVYTGEYSRYRGRRHGRPSDDLGPERFVVFSQNHDQIGNRMHGERLSSLVSLEKVKLAAGLVILGPNLPLLFMGEEYGEKRPFLYFMSHTNPDLVEAVRKGRREEFRGVEGGPDPHSLDTYLRCKLERVDSPLRGYYRSLLQHRRPPARACAEAHGALLRVEWPDRLLLANFSEHPLPLPPVDRPRVLDSADPRWNGPGSPAGHLAPTSLSLFVQRQN